MEYNIGIDNNDKERERETEKNGKDNETKMQYVYDVVLVTLC